MDRRRRRDQLPEPEAALDSPVMLRKIGVYVVLTVMLACALISPAFAQSGGTVTSIMVDQAIEMASSDNAQHAGGADDDSAERSRETTASLRS